MVLEHVLPFLGGLGVGIGAYSRSAPKEAPKEVFGLMIPVTVSAAGYHLVLLPPLP